METIDNEAKVNQLEKFFDCNMKIKKSLADIAFSEENVYDEFYAMAYADKIYEELLYMEEQFLIMSTLMFGESITNVINKKFSAYNRVLASCGADGNKLRNFYVHCISEISEKFKNSVKETCVGYSMFNNVWGLINSDISINALLHVMHASVMNSEHIYGSVNKLGEKQVISGDFVVFRGKSNNQIANMLFEHFPESLDCGPTDIVALDKKIMIMVRDRGHALTIELEEYPDGVMVRYFVPKLCNVEMINALPGINKVPLDAPMHSGARGEFFSKKEDVVIDIYNFINSVPTDLDMPDLRPSSFPR